VPWTTTGSVCCRDVRRYGQGNQELVDFAHQPGCPPDGKCQFGDPDWPLENVDCRLVERQTAVKLLVSRPDENDQKARHDDEANGHQQDDASSEQMFKRNPGSDMRSLIAGIGCPDKGQPDESEMV